MTEDSSRRSRPWWSDPESLRALQIRLVVLALVTTTVLLAVAGLSLPSAGPETAGPVSSATEPTDDAAGQVGDAVAKPAFGAALLPTEVSDPVVRRQALLEQLRARTSAVLTRNAAAYLATVDPADRSALVAARQTQERLARLPLDSFDYTIEEVAANDVGSDTDPSPRAQVQVDLRYTLKDFDPLPAHTGLVVEFVHQDIGWKITGEAARGPSLAVWQLGDLQVVRGVRSLVIGVAPTNGDADRARVADYARIADRAVTAVSNIWGSDWNRRVVLVVPSSTAAMARLLGRATDSLDKIAAITTDETSSQDRPTFGSSAARQGAERVWVNAALMSTLNSKGRAIVLRHEIAHVASDAPAVTATPLWLEEGLAEVIGYSGSGVPFSVAVQELVADARAGRIPRGLTRSTDFGSGSAGLAQAYEASHVACAVIASRIGVPGLVRLYRQVAAGDPRDPDGNFEEALSAGTGWDRDGFMNAVRDQIRALAQN